MIAHIPGVFSIAAADRHASVPLNTEFASNLTTSRREGIIELEKTGRRLKGIEPNCVGNAEPLISEL